jgi:hypothetical protein
MLRSKRSGRLVGRLDLAQQQAVPAIVRYGSACRITARSERSTYRAHAEAFACADGRGVAHPGTVPEHSIAGVEAVRSILCGRLDQLKRLAQQPLLQETFAAGWLKELRGTVELLEEALWRLNRSSAWPADGETAAFVTAVSQQSDRLIAAVERASTVRSCALELGAVLEQFLRVGVLNGQDLLDIAGDLTAVAGVAEGLVLVRVREAPAPVRLAAHAVNVALVASHVGLSKQELKALQDWIAVAGLYMDSGLLELTTNGDHIPHGLCPTPDLKLWEHPRISVCLARRTARLPEPVLRAIAQHHELLDGSGYPDHRSGDEVCPLARLLAVSDVFLSIIAGQNDCDPAATRKAYRKTVDLAGKGKLDLEFARALPVELPHWVELRIPPFAPGGAGAVSAQAA